MSRFDFTTYHAQANFGNLAYHVKGNLNGERALIFLHGHLDTAMENGSYKIFDRNDDALQIMIDHRWHGCSIRTKYYPSLSERAEDIDIVLEDVAQRFPRINKYNLIGYSQGGSVLLLYLLSEFKQKHLVESAFLVAPRLDLKRYLNWFEKEIAALKVTKENSFTKKYKSKGFINYNTQYLEEFETTDFYKLIGKLATKTTLVRGEQDDLVTEEEAFKLMDLNKQYLKYFAVKDWRHNLEAHHWHELYDYIYQLLRAEHSLIQTVV